MCPIARMSSGAVSTAEIQKRRFMSVSSGFSTSSAVTVRGSRAMPQIGQAPGPSRTICGCMGHVQRIFAPAGAEGADDASGPARYFAGSAANFSRQPGAQKGYSRPFQENVPPAARPGSTVIPQTGSSVSTRVMLMPAVGHAAEVASEADPPEHDAGDRRFAVDLGQPRREAVERHAPAESRLDLPKDREVARVPDRAGVDARAVRRTVLGALPLEGQRVDVPVHRLDAAPEKVRVRELPGPLDQGAPLDVAVGKAVAPGRGRDGQKAPRERLLPGRGGRDAGLVSFLDRLRMLEV